MKDVIYSIPIDDFIDRVNAADTELVKDRNLKYNIDDAIIVDANYF